MDLEKAIDYFLTTKSAKLSPRTVEDYSAKLYRFAQWAEVDEVSDLTVHLMRGYVGHLVQRKQAGELSSATVASNLRPLKVFTRWLANEEPPLLATDPFKRVEVPEPDKNLHDIIPDEDARALLNACDLNTHEGRRNHAMMCFLLDTGVRVGELTNMKHADLDMKGRAATVIGKGRKQRQVFFSATTAASMTRYIYRTPERYKSEWLWTSIRRNVGGRMTMSGVGQMLRRAKLDSGVKCRVNPHTFRHTFATNYLRAGGDLNSLMRLMGHADLTILQTYLSLANDDLKQKHEQFSAMSRVVGGRR